VGKHAESGKQVLFLVDMLSRRRGQRRWRRRRRRRHSAKENSKWSAGSGDRRQSFTCLASLEGLIST
jgi:hypothetical protein